MAKYVMVVDDGDDVTIQVDGKGTHLGDSPEYYEVMAALVGEQRPQIEWYEDGVHVMTEEFNPDTGEWESRYEIDDE